jgi:hypothetical protein
VKAGAVEATGRSRADATSDFDRKDVTQQQVATGTMSRRRHTHCGGQGSGRHVHNTGEMSVVVIEAVDQLPVHQRGVTKTEPQWKTDHGLIAAATHRLHRGRRTSGERIRRRGIRDAERVDDEHLGPIHDCTRQIVEPQLCREIADNAGQR